MTDYVAAKVNFCATPNVIIPDREVRIGLDRLLDSLTVVTNRSKMETRTDAEAFIFGTNVRNSFSLPAK